MKHGALLGGHIVCAAAAICGCGPEVSGPTGGGGAGGSGQVPATGIGGSAVLAIHRLWLGETTPEGAPSPDALEG